MPKEERAQSSQYHD